MQLRKDRLALLLVSFVTLFIVDFVAVALDAVQLADQIQGDIGPPDFAFFLHFLRHVENASSSPCALCQIAWPLRCNRRNRQSSDTRDNFSAGAKALPAHSWLSNQTGLPACQMARYFVTVNHVIF